MKTTRQRFNKTKGRFNKPKGRFNKPKGRFNKTKGRFNKTKGRFNKTKGKNRKNNTKKIKKVLQKAGKILGEGSYGEVYGDPRIKCSDENDDDAEYKDYYATVSKVFKKIDTRDHEFNATKFKDKLGEEYFVFPLKKCNTTMDKLNKDEDFVEKRRKTDHEERGETGPEERGETGPEEWIYMITYPKADVDLYSLFTYLSSYTGDYSSILEWLTKALPNISRIGEGVKLLQDNNYIHGDIKVENCLYMPDGKYKIGDLDSIANINDIKEDLFPKFPRHFAFGCHIWPAITIFCEIFYLKNIKTDYIVKRYTDYYNSGSNIDGFNVLRILTEQITNNVNKIFPDDFDSNRNIILNTINLIVYEKRITNPSDYVEQWKTYLKVWKPLY